MKRVIQLCAAAAVTLACLSGLAQSVPQLINYQGQLLDASGNPMPTGDYEIEVRLFPVETGGDALWGPQRFNGQSGMGLGPKIPVVGGRFNLILGPQDTSARDLAGVFAANQNVFLELKVGTGNPISPRQQMLSAPFAFNAANAANVLEGAITAAKLDPTIGVWTRSGDNVFRSAGNVGIGTSNPEFPLHVFGAISITNVGPGAEVLNLNTERSWSFRQLNSGAGTALELASVGGGGNKNFVINTTGLVGIGTTSPQLPLHIASDSVAMALHDTGPDSTQTGYVSYRNGSFAETARVGFDSSASPDFHIFNGRPGGDIVLNPQTGNVGIKRLPTANDLEVEGTASKTAAGSWLANSDARIKTDVRTVTGALDKLAQVRPVEFRYTAEYRAQHPSIEDRTYLNVIAQEFQEVFPEAVKRSGDKLPNGDDILQVDTYPLTIYSAAAIQELNQKVEVGRQKAEARVQKLEAENAELKARLERLERLLNTGAAGEP
ncbi:MAG: tail fiber domain-containing protein [Verrucomicrobia bacterium]|nr:tail fiber domain-containing protein [Verrucomicrobiota bacterium]